MSTFQARVGYIAGVFCCAVGGLLAGVGDWPAGVVIAAVGLATMFIVRKDL